MVDIFNNLQWRELFFLLFSFPFVLSSSLTPIGYNYWKLTSWIIWKIFLLHFLMIIQKQLALLPFLEFLFSIYFFPSSFLLFFFLLSRCIYYLSLYLLLLYIYLSMSLFYNQWQFIFLPSFFLFTEAFIFKFSANTNTHKKRKDLVADSLNFSNVVLLMIWEWKIQFNFSCLQQNKKSEGFFQQEEIENE